MLTGQIGVVKGLLHNCSMPLSPKASRMQAAQIVVEVLLLWLADVEALPFQSSVLERESE